MKILHISDLHYCAKHLAQIEAAMDVVCAVAADCCIIAGDSFDAAIQLHEPAVAAFAARIKALSDIMPVLVLQGTFSHDKPGALDFLRSFGRRVYVADRIEVVTLAGNIWLPGRHPGLMHVCCIPSVNKGAVAAKLGTENVHQETAEHVNLLCGQWGAENIASAATGIIPILVAHGTVSGAVTETAHAMMSPDHEFSLAGLFSANASACLLGHIHRRQAWEQNGRHIAYPGSITKLIHGHQGQVGGLLWHVTTKGSEITPIDAPSRKTIEMDFPGTPDMAALAEAAKDCLGAYVRIRGSVDEEHRSSIDRDGINALFRAAAEVKVEIRVNPLQRQRAAGISQAKSIADQVTAWAGLSEIDPAPLIDRLHSVRSHEPEKIVRQLIERSADELDDEF